jgi:hypothetical protein
MKEANAPVREGKYIYCIVELNELDGLAENLCENLRGIGMGGRGDDVRAVCAEGIAAIVSDTPIRNYTVSRENMLCHSKVVGLVMKDRPVLPVRFSTIAGNEEKVRKILKREETKFKELLKTIRGKRELGLRAVFREEALYTTLPEKYDDIRELKKKMAGVSAKTSRRYQDDIVDIGKRVEHAIREEKRCLEEEMLKALSPLSVETKLNDPYGELMILNAAFLVEDSREAEFDRVVDELGGKHEQIVRLKYSGNVPPCNFVNLVINMQDE